MSKLGNRPIDSNGVNINITGSQIICSVGSNQMFITLHNGISVEKNGDLLQVHATDELLKDSKRRPLFGTTISLLKNAILGLKSEFKKTILLEGTGYKAVLAGKLLTLSIGYSHLVEVKIPNNVNIVLDTTKKMILSSFDKQAVGAFASILTKLRRFNVYKGSGIIDPENPRHQRRKEVKKK